MSSLAQYATGPVQKQGEIFAWHEFVTNGDWADASNLNI
jgi:hypothetical protein